MYVYPVMMKRKRRRTGVWVPQYISAYSSGIETAVRSIIPRNARMRAINAVAAEGLLNTEGVGFLLISSLSSIPFEYARIYQFHGLPK